MAHRFTPSKQGRLNALTKAATLVEGRLLIHERELMGTKWFAYRFLSPIEATMLFAEHYLSARKAFVRENIDIEAASLVGGVSLAIPPGPNRAFTQLWIARQHADELCVPYDLYMEFCFWFAGRRQRAALPMPNQLRANQSTETAWFAEFEKFIDGRLTMAALSLQEIPQYDVRAYKALPAQVAVRQFIAEQIAMATASWPQQIERWSLDRRLFPVLGFRRLMGRDTLKAAVVSVRVRATSLSSSVSFVQPADHTFWQACFGVPGAQNMRAAPCAECQQAENCTAMAGLVERSAHPVTAGIDPVLRKKREAGRLRTAKCRAKARSIILLAGPTVGT